MLDNQNVASAMKGTEFDNLVLELNDLIDKISFVLRQIEMDMYETQDYFTGPVAEAVRNKYETYSSQTNLLLGNLLTYPKDLINCKIGLQENDSQITKLIDDYSLGLNAEAKKIEIKEDN